MGMFDYVRCEYPLPDGYEGKEFQTKDINYFPQLARYTITADGRLLAPDGAPLEFNEYVEFYDFDTSRVWRCYRAKFTDGALTEITLGEDHGTVVPTVS